MLHKILTAVDFSETCPQVLEEAIAMASLYNAKLMLLHVISTEEELYLPYSLYPVMDGYSYLSDSALDEHQQRIKEHKRQCQEKLTELQTQALNCGVDAEVKLVTGEPGHAICDVMKDWQGELIVIGHRGLRGIKEMVLGSVSNFVMHHAPCSVLVLRPSDTALDATLETDQVVQSNSHR